MANYPRPSKTDMGADNETGFTAELPTTFANGSGQIIDGKPLLKAKQPGKLNENRTTSLTGRKDKD